MLRRRTDIALERDPVGRFVPWQVAFMVFLSALAIAAVAALQGVIGHWQQGVEATLTVQVPPAERASDDDRRLDAALRALRAIPDVARAEVVDAARVAALLRPWLGSAETVGELPLPALIDVRLAPGTAIGTGEIERRVRGAVADALVDDHRVWLFRLVRLIRGLEIVAAAALALTALLTVATVVFATRSALAVHRDAIEVLHLVGAQDRYIAGQFAWRAMTLGLKGGVLGVVGAIGAIAGVGWLANAVGGGVLPRLEMGVGGWAAVVLLTPAAALIAMLTARTTVLRGLGRLP